MRNVRCLAQAEAAGSNPAPLSMGESPSILINHSKKKGGGHLDSRLQEFLELVEKAMAADSDIFTEAPEEEPTEEVIYQHHTGMLCLCVLPGIFHRRLIPWYPSGFT